MQWGMRVADCRAHSLIARNIHDQWAAAVLGYGEPAPQMFTFEDLSFLLSASQAF